MDLNWNEIGADLVEKVRAVLRKRRMKEAEDETLVREIARELGFARARQAPEGENREEFVDRLVSARKNAVACARKLRPVSPELANRADSIADAIKTALDDLGPAPGPFKGDAAMLHACVGVYLRMGSLNQRPRSQALLRELVGIIFPREAEEVDNFRKRLEQNYLPHARAEQAAAEMLMESVLDGYGKSVSEKELARRVASQAEIFRAMIRRKKRNKTPDV